MFGNLENYCKNKKFGLPNRLSSLIFEMINEYKKRRDPSINHAVRRVLSHTQQYRTIIFE